jgi:murein peptide amidase A
MLIAVAMLACTGCASTHPGHVTESPVPTPHEPPPAAEGPYIDVGDVGRSVEGRPLVLHTFGRGTCDLFVLGGIHGNEPGSAVVCEELVKYLRANPGALMGRSVAVLSAANPSGLARRLRTNKNLVDLNRNFPASNWQKTRKTGFYGGAVAGSEPETQAMLDVLERLRPQSIISVHAMAQPCNNYDGPGAHLAQLMSLTNGYPVRPNMGYPTPGSLGTWAGVDRQIPIVTLELPARQRGEDGWKDNREALLAAIHRATPDNAVTALISPSPGTPGEGRGEGSMENREQRAVSGRPSP